MSPERQFRSTLITALRHPDSRFIAHHVLYVRRLLPWLRQREIGVENRLPRQPVRRLLTAPLFARAEKVGREDSRAFAHHSLPFEARALASGENRASKQRLDRFGHRRYRREGGPWASTVINCVWSGRASCPYREAGCTVSNAEPRSASHLFPHPARLFALLM